MKRLDLCLSFSCAASSLFLRLPVSSSDSSLTLPRLEGRTRRKRSTETGRQSQRAAGSSTIWLSARRDGGWGRDCPTRWLLSNFGVNIYLDKLRKWCSKYSDAMMLKFYWGSFFKDVDKNYTNAGGASMSLKTNLNDSRTSLSKLQCSNFNKLESDLTKSHYCFKDRMAFWESLPVYWKKPGDGTAKEEL